MKRKFTVIIERKGDEYVARCPEVPGVKGRGLDMEVAIKDVRTAITKKLKGGSDAGSASYEGPDD